MLTRPFPFRILIKLYVQLKRFCFNAFKIERFTLNFVLRNSLAALLAMGVAWSFGFSEYYWAAVTSWVMAINGRGQIISKSLYRLAGTAIGALFVFLIMPLSSIPWLYLLVLSVWTALSASTACLLRRFRAYTAQLAGYTATIIGGFVLVTPQELHIGFTLERFALVLIGIFFSTIVSLLLIPRADKKELGDETRQWASKSTKWAADIIADAVASLKKPPSLELWRGISEFEYSCTCAAIESTKIKRYLPTIKSILAAQLSLISAVRAFCRLHPKEYIAQFTEIEDILRKIADKIKAHQSIEEEIQSIKNVAQSFNGHNSNASISAQTLTVKAESIAMDLDRMNQDLLLLREGGITEDAPIPSITLHYDWQRSLSSGIRTFIPTFLVGMIWLYIGDREWMFAFVMTSIACILFGVFPGATKGLRGFLISISSASIVYILWSALAHALHIGALGSFIAVIVLTTIAAFPLSNGYPRAMDFNTNLPVLMLAMGAEQFGFTTQLSAGFGLTIGVVVTYIAFWLPVRHENARVRAMDEQLNNLFIKLADDQWLPHQHVWEECIYDLMTQASLSSLSRAKLSYLFTRYQAVLDNGDEVIWLRSVDLKQALPQRTYDHIDHALKAILHFSNISDVREELLRTAVFLLKEKNTAQNDVNKMYLYEAAASLVSLAYGITMPDAHVYTKQ